MSESFAPAIGAWTGEKELYLSSNLDDVRLCNATLNASAVAKGGFLALAYTWSYKSEPQEGLILFGVDAKRGLASGAWVDSWHQHGSVMSLSGRVGAEGEADMSGSYPAPPGPDWGWRIVVKVPAEDSFLVEMFNRSPEGQEDLAVRLRLVRTQRDSRLG